MNSSAVVIRPCQNFEEIEACMQMQADVWGYSEAGKTGTADKVIKGAYDPHFVCASFVGVVPADDPAFVLIVSLDEPEYGYEPGQGRKHMGGFCAAPIFREIAQRSLEYLGIAPDDPHGYPPGDPVQQAKKSNSRIKTIYHT